MTGYSFTSQNEINPTWANSYLEHRVGNRERLCHISYNHINEKELLKTPYFAEESISV